MINLPTPISKIQLNTMLAPPHDQQQIYKKTQETESLNNCFSPNFNIKISAQSDADTTM